MEADNGKVSVDLEKKLEEDEARNLAAKKHHHKHHKTAEEGVSFAKSTKDVLNLKHVSTTPPSDVEEITKLKVMVAEMKNKAKEAEQNSIAEKQVADQVGRKQAENIAHLEKDLETKNKKMKDDQ